MVIYLELENDTVVLTALNGYLDKLDANALRIARNVAIEAFQEIRQQMLTALQFYPPVPPGSKYKRTYRLRRGWIVDLSLTGDTIALVITNPTTYTRYVVGALTNQTALAALAQRDFHRANGWPLALDTAHIWFDKFTDAFIEAFVQAIIADIRGAL
jgi:hypothetical protein